ncbi:MAG: hypothetical protein KIT31_36845 [Deltaproteobacteria bacterium]|nr:hypothetical protein [Deltaproteobacteria bacterium]
MASKRTTPAPPSVWMSGTLTVVRWNVNWKPRRGSRGGSASSQAYEKVATPLATTSGVGSSQVAGQTRPGVPSKCGHHTV